MTRVQISGLNEATNIKDVDFLHIKDGVDSEDKRFAYGNFLLSVNKGGTGATTAAQARINLEVFGRDEYKNNMGQYTNYIFDTVALAQAGDTGAGGVVTLSENDTLYLRDRGAFFDVVLTSSVTPNDFDIIASTSQPTLSYQLIVQPVMDIRSFGVSSTASDNSGAISAACNNPEVIRLTGGNGDSYTFTSNITVTRNLDIFGNFTFQSASNAQFIVRGSSQDMGDLTAGGVIRTDTVSVGTSAGFSVGDLIIVHNQVNNSFSKHRADYQDGEFNIIKNIDNALLELNNLLESTYPVAATTRVIKVTPVSVNLEGVKFRETFSESPTNVLFIQHAKGVNISGNTEVFGGSASALQFSQCYQINIDGGTYTNVAASAGLQYGIAVINSSQVYIQNVDAYGTRHGITTGSNSGLGAVPCRHIKIEKCNVSNDAASLVYAADFHGNTCDAGYYDCYIAGDMGLAGENITAQGNTIVGNRVNPPIELQEVVGGDYYIKDNTVIAGATAAYARVIGFSSSTLSANVDRTYSMNVENLVCEIVNNTTSIITIFNAAEGSVRSRWKLQGCHITGVDANLADIISGSISNTAGHPTPPIRPDYVELSDLTYAPNSTTTAFMTFASGSWSGCRVTMPTVSDSSAVTIPAGQWYSTAGGSGNTGVYAFNYPDYPIAPTVKVEHDGFALASSPRFFGGITSVDNTQANVFATTAGSSLTAGANRNLTIVMTAALDNVVVP